MELIRENRGREVHLQMEDHRTEEFINKKSRFQVIQNSFSHVRLYETFVCQAFTGEGQVLGSPAPSVAVLPNLSLNPTDCEKRAAAELNLNEAEPTTSVQVQIQF